MKRRSAARPAPEAVTTVFMRGMLVTGMLAALRDRRDGSADGLGVLRHAFQGGAALAAGTVAAAALARRDYGLALTALAAGAAGVAGAEILFDPKEKFRVQED